MNSLANEQVKGEPGLLRDLLNGLVHLAEQAQKPDWMTVKGLPPDMVAYHLPGTQDIRTLTLPQPPTVHEPADLESFCRLASQGPGTVWIDAKHLHYVRKPEAGQADRREGAKLDLKTSALFRRLQHLGEKGEKFDQKTLIRFLRRDMAGGTSSDSDALLKAVLEVKFRKGQEIDSTVEHGKASIGKQLMAEMANATDLPESVTFFVPVYINRGLEKHTFVGCTVEIDAENACFYLACKPDHLDNAILDGLAFIAEEVSKNITQENCPILFGRPWRE